MPHSSLRLLIPAFALWLTAGSVRADDSLDAPDDVTAEARGPDEIRLHWSSVSRASYLVFRSYGGNSPRQLEETSSTSFEDRDVKAGETYVYVVKAKRDSNVSKESRPARIVVPIPAPEDLAASASGTDIQLGWSRVWGASEYIVKRSNDEYGSFREVETTSSTRFTDHDRSPGTTYYYVIEARSSSGVMSKPSRPAHAAVR